MGSSFIGRPFFGALVRKAANQTAADYTSLTAVAWDQEAYDHGGWHDNASNNHRLTVPPGIGLVRVNGSVHVNSVTASLDVRITVLKNSSPSFDGNSSIRTEVDATAIRASVQTAWFEVVPTDHLALALLVATDTSITVVASMSFLAIEGRAI